jgi:hypothetical protein
MRALGRLISKKRHNGYEHNLTHHTHSIGNRSAADLAVQQRLGLLSDRRVRVSFHCRFGIGPTRTLLDVYPKSLL